MDLAALNLCNTTTQARCTQEPSVEWNAKSIHYWVNAAVNNSTCQVIKLAHNQEDLQLKEKSKVCLFDTSLLQISHQF